MSALAKIIKQVQDFQENKADGDLVFFRGQRANYSLMPSYVNADLILPVLADEILPVYRPDSVEANGSDA